LLPFGRPFFFPLATWSGRPRSRLKFQYGTVFARVWWHTTCLLQTLCNKPASSSATSTSTSTSPTTSGTSPTTTETTPSYLATGFLARRPKPLCWLDHEVVDRTTRLPSGLPRDIRLAMHVMPLLCLRPIRIFEYLIGEW
ncbi:hypothetical protein KCU62_g427, partial [Aureobasidium sp. EXF-3399]